jgi:hypothetical protein
MTAQVLIQDKSPAVISANPLDLPAATFSEGLDRRKANRAALMAWSPSCRCIRRKN